MDAHKTWDVSLAGHINLINTKAFMLFRHESLFTLLLKAFSILSGRGKTAL